MERLSKAGIRLDSYLNELQQISNLESLRPYLIKEGCFLQKYNENQVNIIIPTIGFEELKRLVRLWKLDHAERNFWKTHLDLHSLVDALITHINEKGKTIGREPKPTLPGPSMMTSTSMDKASKSNVRINQKLPNLFNGKEIFREKSIEEILIASKYISPGIQGKDSNTSTSHCSNSARVLLDRWRWADCPTDAPHVATHFGSSMSKRNL